MRDDPVVVALVAGARTGSKAAWDDLVERYAPLVYSICRRFHLSEADTDDVGQTVWLRLVERLPSLREPAALPGWLATTTRRECLAVVRAVQQRERRESPVDSEIGVDGAEIDQALLEHERDAVLREAFAELPGRCRELLSYLLQDPPVTYAEIASRLGMPVGGVGPNRDRCLKRLRRCQSLAALIGSAAEKVEGEGGEGHDKSVVER